MPHAIPVIHERLYGYTPIDIPHIRSCATVFIKLHRSAKHTSMPTMTQTTPRNTIKDIQNTPAIIEYKPITKRKTSTSKMKHHI